ncbi:MAG: response regulator [Planctomycetota bacterium]
MSEPTRPPEERDTLEAFGACQLAALAKDWGGVLGADVVGGKPAVLKPGEALPDGKELWPAVVTVLDMESPEGAQLVVVAPYEEAARFFEIPLPDGSPGSIEHSDEALREVFAFLGASTDRAFRKDISSHFRVKGCSSRRVRDLEEIQEVAREADPSVLRLGVSARGGRRLRLWVVLPRAFASSMVEARGRSGKLTRRPPSTVIAAAATGGCILVVDDQILIRRVLRWLLERHGYQVVEASTGAEALNKLSAHKPALVLLDVMMPQMDGFELCRRMRASPEYRALPVIFCTAKDTRQDVIEAIKSGAQDYIIKPFKKELLLEKIARVIAGSSVTEGAAPPPDALTP